MTNDDQRSAASRRTVLCGAALAALGLTTAACGGDSDGGGSGSGSSSAGPDKQVDLGSAAEVPVGGTKAFPEEKVLVSQPEKGTFMAFSAVCTHQGATIDKAEKDAFVCPRHGSRFQADTGKVTKGPATAPLPKLPVKVKNGKLLAGPAKE
ncbi:Rieske (2Fe-2S) protein [Streptomyces sp. NPDC048172]|uniref:Rieske (2Fe-2S) protein n=1 Tax=Streptomyces sp. NPDC048172 TaxID=3365505 RepID=UPI003710BA0E